MNDNLPSFDHLDLGKDYEPPLTPEDVQRAMLEVRDTEYRAAPVAGSYLIEGESWQGESWQVGDRCRLSSDCRITASVRGRAGVVRGLSAGNVLVVLPDATPVIALYDDIEPIE